PCMQVSVVLESGPELNVTQSYPRSEREDNRDAACQRTLVLGPCSGPSRVEMSRAGLKPELVDRQDDQGSVVCPRVLAMRPHRVQQLVLERGCGKRDILGQHAHELVFTKLVTGCVAGFRDAVREQQQSISAAQFQLLLVEGSFRLGSEHAVFGVEMFVSAISV